MGGAAALQHRVRSSGPASWRQARDGVGSFDGSYRELAWGELGPREPGCSRAGRPGRGARRPRRGRPPATPRPPPSSRRLEARRDPAVNVVCGDDSIRHGLSDSGARLVVADEPERWRFADSGVPTLVLDRHARRCLDRACRLRHRGRRSRAALLHVRDDRACRRASCTPTATSWATRSSSTATRLPTASGFTAWASGRGLRDRAAARPVAARGRAMRTTARGRVPIRIGNSTS